MPYNHTPIPPPEKATGQSVLPLARVKRIVQQDDDIELCSKNALFVITVATEMFVQYITQQGYNVVKSERKPRKNLQYKDMATAVARIDTLEFLSDVVPRTTTFKEFKAKKSKKAAAAAAAQQQQSLSSSSSSKTQAPGQTTLDSRFRKKALLNGHANHQEESIEEEPYSE